MFGLIKRLKARRSNERHTQLLASRAALRAKGSPGRDRLREEIFGEVRRIVREEIAADEAAREAAHLKRLEAAFSPDKFRELYAAPKTSGLR